MGILDRVFNRWTAADRTEGETAADRAEWLNTTLQTVGRAVAQQQLVAAHHSRSFEAAETPAWTESWPTHGSPINEDLARQLPTMKARARGIARNNEWATNYLIKLDDNVLGPTGIRLQMHLKKSDGTQDKELNALLESAWDRLCENIDVSGLSFRDVESLVLSSLPQDGELLYRMRPGAGPMRFQIQLLPTDLIDVNLRRDWQGNRVRMGVEINDDGLPVAYWLQAAKSGDQPSDYISVGRHIRVPAAEIQHHFLRREVGQLRGFPWLSAGSRRLWMLSDFEQAAAVASSNAAKRQGFFYTEDGEAPDGFADTIVSTVLAAAKAEGKELTQEEIKSLVANAEKYSTTMPGQYDTLPNGTKYQPNDSKWPDVSASEYVKNQVRGWSAARGMSYVTHGNDLEAVNYSSAQVGIGDEREHYKRVQTLNIAWLHKPVFAAALPYLILMTPGLDPRDQARYLAAATWQPRRWQPIDPTKSATADEINLRLKTTSRRRIILQRGEDPDEIADEVAAEDKLYGEIPHPVTGATASSSGDGGDPKKGTSND